VDFKIEPLAHQAEHRRLFGLEPAGVISGLSALAFAASADTQGNRLGCFGLFRLCGMTGKRRFLFQLLS
jgi:hypothetical protein